MVCSFCLMIRAVWTVAGFKHYIRLKSSTDMATIGFSSSPSSVLCDQNAWKHFQISVDMIKLCLMHFITILHTNYEVDELFYNSYRWQHCDSCQMLACISFEWSIEKYCVHKQTHMVYWCLKTRGTRKDIASKTENPTAK